MQLTVYMIIVLNFLWVFPVLSQPMGKNDTLKVEKQIEFQYDYSTGVQKKFLCSEKFITFDGKLLEEIEYLTNGLKSKHKKYRYDENGNLITELFIDNQGNIYKRVEIEYIDKSKKRKTTFDKFGRETARKEYETDTVEYISQ